MRFISNIVTILHLRHLQIINRHSIVAHRILTLKMFTIHHINVVHNSTKTTLFTTSESISIPYSIKTCKFNDERFKVLNQSLFVTSQLLLFTLDL